MMGSETWSRKSRPISDVMTDQVICVKPEMSVESVTALFLERGISGAPVVDDAGKAIGVISKTDLVRETFDQGAVTEWEMVKPTLGMHGAHVAQSTRSTVGEIMTPVVYTLNEHSSVAEAARLMVEKRVHRIPVVSDKGHVVGIVSVVDLLGPLASETPDDISA